MSESSLNKNLRRALAGYLIINLAISVTIALPAAGMINNLLAKTEFAFARGVLLWLSLTIIAMFLTLPLIPRLRRRVNPIDHNGL